MKFNELYDFLKERKSGVFLLSGCSGCGKSTLLKKLRDEYGAIIMTCENIVEDVFFSEDEKKEFDEKIDDFIESVHERYFCIEDIDLFLGKETTLSVVKDITEKISKKAVVIFTTIYSYDRMLSSNFPIKCEELVMDDREIDYAYIKELLPRPMGRIEFDNENPFVITEKFDDESRFITVIDYDTGEETKYNLLDIEHVDDSFFFVVTEVDNDEEIIVLKDVVNDQDTADDFEIVEDEETIRRVFKEVEENHRRLN